MQKGYVYIWTNTSTQKQYVGARKGNWQNDTYICSSEPMMIDYNQNPDLFERQIVFEGPLDEVAEVELAIQIEWFDRGHFCYNKKITKYTGHLKEDDPIFTKTKDKSIRYVLRQIESAKNRIKRNNNDRAAHTLLKKYRRLLNQKKSRLAAPQS